MNAKALTDQFVSAYVKLLDGLHGDVRVLNAIRANILCSQYNKNLEQNNENENESTNIDNHCKYCLTPWKNGNFTMKTIPKCKNSKLKKKSRTFILVMKCLVCLRVTNSFFEKNKKLNKKPTKEVPKRSTENIVETPKIEEVKVKMDIKKPKKKKRNLYAGLNPLVFKNRDLCKKNKKKPITNL